mmetsp:Transcript_1230/g.2284  ORF Transcript_1230/g.2284 Transcript_1230/m.2284 type:complete len:105 (-) Transcript_1230:164-478(-)
MPAVAVAVRYTRRGQVEDREFWVMNTRHLLECVSRHLGVAATYLEVTSGPGDQEGAGRPVFESESRAPSAVVITRKDSAVRHLQLQKFHSDAERRMLERLQELQ